MKDKELDEFFGNKFPKPEEELFPPIVQKARQDLVNNPPHYTSHPSGVECIQITEHYNFCIGNAIKYLWRNGLKTETNLNSKEKQIEDLQKAIWYINREIANLKDGTYERS